MVSPTFFNLSLNLAIRSSWSEPESASSLVLLLYRVSSSLAAKNIILLHGLYLFNMILLLLLIITVFILAVLGLCCCTGTFCSFSEEGLLFIAIQWLLTATASLLQSTGSRHTDSGVTACEL